MNKKKSSSENLKKARAVRWSKWYAEKGICAKCRQPEVFHFHKKCPVNVFHLVNVRRQPIRKSATV